MDRKACLIPWMSVGMMALFVVATLLVSRAVVQAAGGAASPPVAGDHDRTLPFGGTQRTYRVHVPAGFDPAKAGPLPLVLMLHGAGGDGAKAEEQTDWNVKADHEGFLVVFPDALPAAPDRIPSFLANPRFWDDGSGRGRRNRETVDDVGFLTTVLDDVEGRWPVDRRRVYITGFSSGASMTFRAAASPLVDRVAAFAPVSGHFWQQAGSVRAKRTPSLLLIYGKSDPLNPWDGGEVQMPWGGPQRKPKVMETVDAWAKFAGCTTGPTLLSDRDGVRTVRYGPGREGAEFVFTSIEGMGHTWPGGHDRLPARLVGARTDKLNATDVIWDFFARHRLP